MSVALKKIVKNFVKAKKEILQVKFMFSKKATESDETI